MNLDDCISGIIREMAPWGTEEEKNLKEATLRDLDNQELAIGIAKLDTVQPVGVFWLRSELPTGKTLETATILMVLDGEAIPIRNFQKNALAACYQFEVVRQSSRRPIMGQRGRIRARLFADQSSRWHDQTKPLAPKTGGTRKQHATAPLPSPEAAMRLVVTAA